MNSPNALVHYTTLETLYALFSNPLETANNNLKSTQSPQDPQIILHLGYIEMSNDTEELKFILRKYFKELHSGKEEPFLIEELDYEGWKNYIKDLFPCSFSLMPSRSNDLYKGNIPLWMQYGNMAKGVSIKFDYRKLKNVCNSLDLQLKPITYYSQRGLKENLKRNLNEINNKWSILLEDAILSKPSAWRHEEEWRLYKIAKLTDMKIKMRNGAGYLYTEIKIPIDSIKEIMFGSLVDFETQELAIKTLISQINSLYNSNININITQSKIKIR